MTPWPSCPLGQHAARIGGGTTQPGARRRADPPAGGGNGPLAAFVAGFDLLTSGRPSVPLGLVATLVTTSGVVGATLAFGVFGKRRRDGEQPAPDDVLASQRLQPLGHRRRGRLRRRAWRPAHTRASAVAHAPHPLDAEMAMPRWRRPSLLEARRADPIRDATEVAAPDLRPRAGRADRRARASAHPLQPRPPARHAR